MKVMSSLFKLQLSEAGNKVWSLFEYVRAMTSDHSNELHYSLHTKNQETKNEKKIQNHNLIKI